VNSAPERALPAGRLAPPGPRIAAATTPHDVAAARGLFLEYAQSLDFALCFQDFDAELAALPGAYAPPRGALLLAWDGTSAAGCVALRPLEPGICEMKRLYVRPTVRGTGTGRMLAEAILGQGRALGYRCMRLDTVPTMKAALSLYRALGFRPIPAYCANPVPGAVWMEVAL
jgi:putative acetyltransferase